MLIKQYSAYIVVVVIGVAILDLVHLALCRIKELSMDEHTKLQLKASKARKPKHMLSVRREAFDKGWVMLHHSSYDKIDTGNQWLLVIGNEIFFKEV